MSEASVKSGLIPHLVVKNAVAAVEYYKAALGAEEMMRMPTPDGRLMHAALKIGDAHLFLCDDFPEYCGGVSARRAGRRRSPCTCACRAPTRPSRRPPPPGPR